MNKLLVVVDMQNDFIDGSLGTPEAQAIVQKVVDKIQSWDGFIFYTMDSHNASTYLNSLEGQRLPVGHCLEGSNGILLNKDVEDCFRRVRRRVIRPYYKHTFGCTQLASQILDHYDVIEIVGLCTDVCVVSNALLLRSYCPNMPIVVDASCCAGTTPEAHEAALQVMQSCQIDIINWGEDERCDF